jgi:FAD/FMN-containing dehydrogenase
MWGLSTDALQALDVVTADGELVYCSPSENKDLFWVRRLRE